MTKDYSARSAALRALKGEGKNPADFDIRKMPNGRFMAFAQAGGGKEITAMFPPPNVTRENELKAIAAKAAEMKKTKAAIKAKPPKAQKQHKPSGKRAAILADAQAGKLPSPPDFSAETHTRFRPKLAELVALVKAKDIKALKAYPIKPISTSPKAMDRYRNLAVIALQAQAKAAA